MTNTAENLMNCGYTKQDILDLVFLFENQVKLLAPNINSLDEHNIQAEIHKLKGGCELLLMSSEASELKRLSSTSVSNNVQRGELRKLLNQLLQELDSLRTIVNSN